MSISAVMRSLMSHPLDRQTGEIGGRILGIEDLPIEEGLYAARRSSGDLIGRDADRRRRPAPEVLAVDLRDQRFGVEVGWQVAPALILGQEPEIVASERIRGVIAPELHHERAVLHDLARAVVDPALGATGDVLDRD